MIEFTKSYKTSDGQVFGSIEDAQTHELAIAIAKSKGATVSFDSAKEIAGLIMENRESIVDVLTTTPNSKPKARAINGGTKKRVKKVAVSDPSTIMTETINS